MFITALILAAGAALIGSFTLTPVVRWWAVRKNFVDRPDGRRKMQKAPVALGGGSAVLAGLLLGVLVLIVGWYEFGLTVKTNVRPLAGLLAATVMLCGVGLVDDAWQLRGRTKLFWQLVAAAIVVFSGHGLTIDYVSLFGHEFYIGNIGSLLALFWLLGSINSFNLIDGVDGLCASVGAIFSVTLGLMALMAGSQVDAIIAFVLAASLIGFLRYNFAPATIYLGDAGSMIIGLILGALALRCSTKEAATVAFSAPLAVWAIPLLDSLAAILRRKLTGRSIYTTDRGHIHHRLLTQGLTTRQAVSLIAGLCLVTSFGSLAGIYFQNEWIGVTTVIVVLAVLISTRVFGHVELMLLNSRLVGLGRSIVSFNDKDERPTHSSHQLQGSLQWEEKIWNALVESAERFDLTRLRLNLYLPHLHEDFYATWSRKTPVVSSKTWRMDLPLLVDGATIGHLHVIGHQDVRGASAQLSSFLDFVEPLEAQIHELLAIANRKGETKSPIASPMPQPSVSPLTVPVHPMSPLHQAVPAHHTGDVKMVLPMLEPVMSHSSNAAS